MKNLNFDVVVKIGSMAMIQKAKDDIDYNRIANLAKTLRPGYILVSSGATEIGRIDYTVTAVNCAEIWRRSKQIMLHRVRRS